MFDIKNLGKNPICKQMADRKKFEDYLHQYMETLANKPDLYNRIMKEVTLVK